MACVKLSPMRFLYSSIALMLMVSCAKVAPPPGKPEMDPPVLRVSYDSLFSGFPVTISVSVADESPIRFVRVTSTDGRKYAESRPMVRETSLVFVLDTLFDYSPYDSVWSGSGLKVEAADVYDNLTSRRIFIRNPHYNPPAPDTTGNTGKRKGGK